MSKKIFQIFTIFLLPLFLAVSSFSQTLACKKSAFNALRQIPELKYKCSENLDEWSDEALTQPNRVNTIQRYINSLEKFTSAVWWNADVNDLNLCDLHGKPGVLSKEEKEDYDNGNYFFKLLGNNKIRIIVARDACYQTGFNGSNMFLLNRVNGKVYAAEIIDGFFTRADFPPIVDFALNGREQIIEIATTSGGLYPTITNYYFTINPKTHCAVPKNLFKKDGKLSNRITSMMLLEDAESYGLPPNSEPLQIIKNNHLAKSCDIFLDTGETFGEDNHRKFTKQTLLWNGKFYE